MAKPDTYVRSLLLVLPLLLGCGGGGTSNPVATATTLTLEVDRGTPLGTIPPTLLGVNTPWQDLGDGIMLEGELVQDRSFRTLGGEGSPWLLQAGNGTVAASASGGDLAPAGGQGYPGCVLLTGGPGATDLTGCSQVLLGPVAAGTPYTLNVSAYTAGPATPVVYAGLGVPNPFTSLAPTQYGATQGGAWVHLALTFTPSQDAPVAALYLGMVGPGSVSLDEVRFSAAPAGRPWVDPMVVARLQALGSKVLCWPGGQLTDSFDWKASVGPTLGRGEVAGLEGRLQTPALGLDEFLQLCATLGAQPLVQVNVNATPDDAADLADYCNGSTATAMGAWRAANGHAAPYGVTRFELGNEPSATAYGGGNAAGAAYAALAAPVADALHGRDAALQVSGALEASFQLADWLATDPLLAGWNPEALALAPRLSFVHGHYYSYFSYDADPAQRFQHIMAGGTVLKATQATLASATPLPLWITEHHLDLEQNGTILAGFLVDAQSGLGVGDQLLCMMQGGFEGACVFNLAEPTGFGMLVGPGTWKFRPAGLVIQLLAPFAGETRIAASLPAAPTLALGGGDGNIPTGITYGLVDVLASLQNNGHLRLALLNRSYDQAVTLALAQTGLATLTWYQPTALNQTNEGSLMVGLTSENRTFTTSDTLVLPPHCLVRLDF